MSEYASAWRGLPRSDRREIIEYMYAELREMTLQALLDEISQKTGYTNGRMSILAEGYAELLCTRLAKSEILRRSRWFGVTNRSGICCECKRLRSGDFHEIDAGDETRWDFVCYECERKAHA